MDSEIRMKYCQFCLSKSFDPAAGIICGFETGPAIKASTCINYSPDIKLIERVNYKQELAKKQTKKKSNLAKFKNIVYIILPVIVLIYFGINWLTLESNHRYTLAKVQVTHQSGSDRFLGIGGYICEFDYVFKVNGHQFYNKGSLGKGRSRLPEPMWPKRFLVKYSPNDPTLNSIITSVDIQNLTFKDIPVNGIHPDSLDYYLLKK